VVTGKFCVAVLDDSVFTNCWYATASEIVTTVEMKTRSSAKVSEGTKVHVHLKLKVIVFAMDSVCLFVCLLFNGYQILMPIWSE